jgi:hypothetical protein
MGVEEGIAYVKALLNASDQEFTNYLNSIAENERLADKISKQLTAGEVKKINAEFETEFDKLPEEFFGIGTESAELFGEGFMQQLKTLLENVKLTISSALSSVSVNANVTGSGGDSNVTGSGGVVNNFTQNNYSNQPLNRTAIYRRTKNLLGFAGGNN